MPATRRIATVTAVSQNTVLSAERPVCGLAKTSRKFCSPTHTASPGASYGVSRWNARTTL